MTNYGQEYPLPQVSTAAVISFVDQNSIPLGAVDRIEILNWYQIDQHNVIGTLQAQEVVDLAAAGANLPGNYVVRSPSGEWLAPSSSSEPVAPI